MTATSVDQVLAASGCRAGMVALVKLLLAKGIVDIDEYCTAVTKEVAFRMLRDHYGQEQTTYLERED